MDGGADLRKLVVDELAWDSSLDESGIQVAASDGTVVLTGTVRSYAEKLAAAQAAARVVGVRTVENHLTVRLPEAAAHDDRTLLQAAQHALRWHILVPKERIQLGVRDGVVILAGTVVWPFQRRAAEHALRHLRGIRGVVNHIRVEPRVTGGSVEETISAAFQRNAGLDAQRIRVEARDGRVILHGVVRSQAERDVAEQAAALAPGISGVDNQLRVGGDGPPPEAGREMRLPFPDTPEPGRAVEGSEIDRITVADLMQREVITISPGARLRDLAELLSYHQIGGVPVVGASGTVLGVVTTRDIVTMTARLPGPDPVRASVPGPEKSEYFASVRATPQLLRRLVTAGMEERRVSEIMTSATFTVPENANLRELAALLLEAGVHRALVMKAGRLSGIVTTMDVMRAVAGQVARPEPRSVEMPLPEVDPGPRP